MVSKTYKILALLSSLIAGTIASSSKPKPEPITLATATILPNQADHFKFFPKAKLEIQSDTKGWGSGRPEIRIIGTITGLKPRQKHGFHIHEFGDIYSDKKVGQIDCAQTGAHYNPFGKNHGGLNSRDRHIGDLGNIRADRKGVAEIDIRAPIDINKDGIIGRALVIHEGEDDEKTPPTGNSGGRLACGAITIAKKPETWAPKLAPVKIGCYKYATPGDYKPMNSHKTCEKACADERFQFYGIDTKKNCACFDKFGKAIKNGRIGEKCPHKSGVYTLFFNPAIHAKRNNGWMVSNKYGTCVEDGSKNWKGVELRKCKKEQLEQRWMATPEGFIINYKTGLCLDAGKNFRDVDKNVCEDVKNQKWDLDHNAISPMKANNKCIEGDRRGSLELEKCDWHSKSQSFDTSGIEQ